MTTERMSDKSMMMNALAMKYLPNEIQSNEFSTRNEATDKLLNHSNNEHPTRKPLTDMSITSYRYMEKYGLL